MSGPHLVIAISRQLGAGGSVLGRRVAEKLGVKYLDRAILEEAAKRLNEPLEAVESFEEKAPTFGERFLNAFAAGALEAGYLSLTPRYDRDVLAVESEIIRRVADDFDCVVVGRASFLTLQGRPGLLKVFLHAPRDFRIAQILERRPDVNPADVPALVRRSDTERARFVHSMTDLEWTDARHFDLCLDTGKLGLDGAEEIILRAAQGIRALPG